MTDNQVSDRVFPRAFVRTKVNNSRGTRKLYRPIRHPRFYRVIPRRHPNTSFGVSSWDNPKPSSIQATKAFKSMGIEVFMITGDNKPTALAVAKLVGIEAGNGQANIQRNPKGS